MPHGASKALPHPNLCTGFVMSVQGQEQVLARVFPQMLINKVNKMIRVAANMKIDNAAIMNKSLFFGMIHHAQQRLPIASDIQGKDRRLQQPSFPIITSMISSACQARPAIQQIRQNPYTWWLCAQHGFDN